MEKRIKLLISFMETLKTFLLGVSIAGFASMVLGLNKSTSIKWGVTVIICVAFILPFIIDWFIFMLRNKSRRAS